jgi:hypothetical protein
VHRATRGWSFGNSVVDAPVKLSGNVSLGSHDYLIALLAPFENGDLPADNKMLQMALHA